MFKMGIEDALSKAKEASKQVTPKKYKMFLASVPVEGERKYLDVTNKFTGDVGNYSSPLRTSNFHTMQPLLRFLRSSCEYLPVLVVRIRVFDSSLLLSKPT